MLFKFVVKMKLGWIVIHLKIEEKIFIGYKNESEL